MELRVLRYFLAVAREENITAAAETLHVTQPTLSKQLMDLEAELGKKLFIRGRRKIILTEEGQFLRKRAQELIDLADKTEAAFRRKGRLSAGMCISAAGKPRVCGISPRPYAGCRKAVRISVFTYSAETAKTWPNDWIRGCWISVCSSERRSCGNTIT